MIYHYPPYNKIFGEGRSEFEAVVSHEKFIYQFRIKADNIGRAEMYVTGPQFLEDLKNWDEKVAGDLMFCAVKLRMVEKKLIKRFRFPFTLRFIFGKLFNSNGTIHASS